MFQLSLIPRRNSIVSALLLSVVAAGAASAAIVGELKIGGDAEVTATTIDFRPFTVGPLVNGTGQVVVTAPGTGPFAPLDLPDLGTIVDRSVAPGVVPAQPAGVLILVPDWLTFANPAFRYAMDLTFINIGQFSSADCFAPAANGQTCTPDAPAPFQSPYNLSNFVDTTGALSANANFSVSGYLRNLDDGTIKYTFTGIFGAIFQNQTYQQVLQEVLAGGSVFPNYSARFEISEIPEASTGMLALVGIGLFSLGHFRRRRARANSDPNS